MHDKYANYHYLHKLLPLKSTFELIKLILITFLEYFHAYSCINP